VGRVVGGGGAVFILLYNVHSSSILIIDSTTTTGVHERAVDCKLYRCESLDTGHNHGTNIPLNDINGSGPPKR
jgi:hypothetical protein